MSFKSLGLNSTSLNFLKEKDFSRPTGIQKLVMPELLASNSIIALAPTGTGKTLSFSLPVMEKIKDLELSGEETKKGSPKVVILSPIKELSIQIFNELKEISHHHKLRVRKLLGGATSKENRMLASGAFEILVAGPDRLNSSVKKGEIKLDDVRYFILDEADQLLDLGFANIIEDLYKKMNSPSVGLFSATIPAQLEDFVKTPFNSLKFKRLVDKDSHKISQKIETFNIPVPLNKKNEYALEFLSTRAKGQGLVFCNLKRNVNELETFLNEQSKDKKAKFSQKFAVFHGDMSAKDRAKVIKSFKEKKIAFLICSDIAARGIHVQGLAWILNFDLPTTPLYYIHRAGRTARQGKSGKVYNFVTSTKRDQLNIQKINKTIKNQLSFKIDEISYMDSAVKAKEEAKKKIKSKKKTQKVTKKKIEKKKFKKSPRFTRKKKKSKKRN